MKINFKQGARRLVLAFIGFCIICALFFYFIGGCIFDNYKFVYNTKMNVIENDIEQEGYNLEQHIEQVLYGDQPSKYIFPSDIECYPYKGYCTYKDWLFKRNKIIKMFNYAEHKSYNYKFIAPSAFQYFFWQVWDFIKIFLIAGLLYGIYLLLELTVCWIIKGFKD